jgi:sugar/nucleoside kinase (ribokinase family)
MRYVVAVGSSSLDTYYEASSWPALGDKVMVKKQGTQVGGLVSNAACAMAACGLTTYLVDTVNPNAKDRILEELDKYGLRSEYVAAGDASTESATVIILVQGERTIFVSKNKPPLVLSDEHKALFRGAYGVYSILPEIKNIQGYSSFLRSLKQGGVKFFWDMEPATFESGSGDTELAQMATILFFNEWGMEKFARNASASTEEAIFRLLDAGVELLVVTRAEKGCQVFAKNAKNAKNSCKLEFEGFRVEAVDTTGAGDAFNSVFLYGYLNGWDLNLTARMANAAGARAVTRLGPKSGAAPIAEITRFMERHTNSRLPG